MSVTLNSERGGPPRTAVSIAPDYGAMGSALAALRIFIGIKLLVSGIEKWKWISHTGLPDKIYFWLHTRPPAPIYWYIPFLQNTVMRHYYLFTWMVVFGELILGAMLIFGLYTRLAAFLAIIMFLNYTFATWNLGFQWQTMNQAMIAIAFTCMVTDAGRIFGLDVSNAFKNPKSIWW